MARPRLDKSGSAALNILVPPKLIARLDERVAEERRARGDASLSRAHVVREILTQAVTARHSAKPTPKRAFREEDDCFRLALELAHDLGDDLRSDDPDPARRRLPDD